MKDLFIGKYIIVYPDNSPVGLDLPSGGYPYKASHPATIKYWNTYGEAQKYISHFPKENFSIVYISSFEITGTETGD